MARHPIHGDFQPGAGAGCGNQKEARPVAERLSDIGIQRELGGLPGWSRRGDSLTKTYRFPTFPAGITFVTRVADVAESMDHHPDIDIQAYAPDVHAQLARRRGNHDERPRRLHGRSSDWRRSRGSREAGGGKRETGTAETGGGRREAGSEAENPRDASLSQSDIPRVLRFLPVSRLPVSRFPSARLPQLHASIHRLEPESATAFADRRAHAARVHATLKGEREIGRSGCRSPSACPGRHRDSRAPRSRSTR